MNPTNNSPTPTIDGLLSRVRRRLLREVWIFGLGRALFVTSLWLLFIFLVDWVLHVPAGVRLVNFALLLVLPIFALWRELIVPLRSVPDEAGLAVLLERAHPDLHELLVSAVQLSRLGDLEAGSAGDPQLIAKVIAEAESKASSLSLDKLSDPLPPRRSFGLGALATAAMLVTFFLQGEAARIFLARIAGGATPWPQRTHLVLEIPVGGDLHTTREHLELDVARGSDLPIIVRSEGKIPDDVTVHFEGGHTALLGSAGRGVFRTLLRSVQEDMTFHITGGDDTGGTPAVTIHVLQPPDVAGIAIRVKPPLYSGLPQRLEFDRDVQVLAGSKVTVFMRPDPPEAQGVVRVLPEDRKVELYATPFPLAEGTEVAAEGAPQGLAFDWTADKNLRYRFELRDSTGLTNPDPGLFGIQVEADRPPSVELLAPARGEVESVLGGALPFKALCGDDFGLTALAWRAVGTSSNAPEDAPFMPLEFGEPSDEAALAPSKSARVKAFASRVIEINSLFGETPPLEGEVFQLEVSAADNREPKAQEATSAAVRVRIVSADEFLRHVQDRLARVRSRVEGLSKLMADKQGEALDLVASMESDEPSSVDAVTIQAALSAARRVEGDSASLTRELASIAESLIWSRIDNRAGPILAELQRSTLNQADRNFHAEPWEELYKLKLADQLGDADFADKLVEMVGTALSISEKGAPAAVAGLRRSVDVTDLTAQYDILVEVTSQQAQARKQAERLLALLSEWDNYQSLISAARDLLKGQNNLLDRTRQFYKEN